jgi:pimeloyl-ACP methyl ester carboxylesterase
VPAPGLHVVEHHTGAAGPVVILIHGGMDRSTSFGGVVRRLPDLHVITYDRRGYARSLDAGPPARSVAEHAGDLIAILADRRAALVGHSYGGDLALAAAIERPDLVAAVGAYEPPMPWLPGWPEATAGGLASMADSPEDAAEAFIRRIVGDDVWERLPDRTKAARRAEGRTLLPELDSIRGPAPFDPAAVGVPLVVGVGTATEGHHRAGTRHLVAMVPGAELLEINGAAHGAHVSHPGGFAAFVRTVVERAGS